jgi:uncharacterized membrane protein
MTKVTGYIVNETSNEAVPFISITALDSAGEPTTTGTVTDENGEFEIDIEESQEIVINGIGYEKKIVSPTDGDIILVSPTSYGLPEVVITETRSVIEAPKKNWWKVAIVVVVIAGVIYLIYRYKKG